MVSLKLVFATTAVIFVKAVPPDVRAYRSNQEIGDLMIRWNRTNDITRAYSIGQSNNGQELWVLELLNDKYQIDPIKPHVKLIGDIHGNEPVGREILLDLIDHLIQGFSGGNEEIIRLINTTHIHILPAMNPDGFNNATEGTCDVRNTQGRGNAKGFDLNRNFPCYKRPGSGTPEPETRAIMQWLKEYPFILSAVTHSGVVVASYPYDYESGAEEGYMPLWSHQESKTEDDDELKYLATVYAQNHGTMATGVKCEPFVFGDFKGGVTNGAQWYPFCGSMGDYNYDFHNCLEITLELDCCKYPNYTEIPRLLNENIKALMTFLKQGHRGVKGIVSSGSEPVNGASITISGRSNDRYTTPSGYFWWILLPGHYTIQVTKEGFETEEKQIRIPEDTEAYQPRPIVLDIKMQETHVETLTSASPMTTTGRQKHPSRRDLELGTETPPKREIIVAEKSNGTAGAANQRSLTAVLLYFTLGTNKWR